MCRIMASGSLEFKDSTRWNLTACDPVGIMAGDSRVANTITLSLLQLAIVEVLAVANTVTPTVHCEVKL